MFELLQDLWGFMRERKKFWLLPVLLVLLLVGALVVLGSNPTVAPFIYTLF
jgi:competence protein ComGC